MNEEIRNLSSAARRAFAQQDWPTVHTCALGILKRDQKSAEGHFLLGVAEKAMHHPRRAAAALKAALELDPDRYDAAVELASQYSVGRRNADVAELLGRYEPRLSNSPLYLDMAGTVYTEIGLPEKAWPLYQKACELQPEIAQFQANRAACAVYVGEIQTAAHIYRKLLDVNPAHQRNHYQLSRLERARDRTHIDEMEAVLDRTRLPPERNIFLYYALGKEYEDLGEWDEAFGYYERGGDAVMKVADYDVGEDIAIVDAIRAACNAEWLAEPVERTDGDRQPLFVVGLPRTGTTLTERILASHSCVQSVGETEFLQMTLRNSSGIQAIEKMTLQIVEAAARQDIRGIADGYVDAVRYRLGDEPVFIDKLPFNVLYLGFIAKAWPARPVVLMRRHPMDACFSMYKQVFTWAYKFSYDLENLATYYLAYESLLGHWRELLGDRLVEVRYEDLVAKQEAETRRLLDRLGLEFEEACLRFEKNPAPSTTASSVQVRQKVHTGSIGRWRHYSAHLEPLADRLRAGGVDFDE